MLHMTPGTQNEPILAHTFFKVPPAIDIYDIEGGYEEKSPTFKTLNPLHIAPGLIRSFWGRVAENPGEVILCTSKLASVPTSVRKLDTLCMHPNDQSGRPATHFRTSNLHQAMLHS